MSETIQQNVASTVASRLAVANSQFRQVAAMADELKWAPAELDEMKS